MFVLGPLLAIVSCPAFECVISKFSSVKGMRDGKNFSCGSLTFKQVLTKCGSTAVSVVLGNVTPLHHGVCDNPKNLSTLVTISVLSSGQFSEVSCSFWYNVIVQGEHHGPECIWLLISYLRDFQLKLTICSGSLPF